MPDQPPPPGTPIVGQIRDGYVSIESPFPNAYRHARFTIGEEFYNWTSFCLINRLELMEAVNGTREETCKLTVQSHEESQSKTKSNRMRSDVERNYQNIIGALLEMMGIGRDDETISGVISDNLARKGIALSAETVRKYIRKDIPE